MHIWLVIQAREFVQRPDPLRVPGPVAFLTNRMHDPRVLAVLERRTRVFERGDHDATTELLGTRPYQGWPFGTHLAHHEALLRGHKVWAEQLGPPRWPFTFHQGVAQMIRGWTRDALFLTNPPDMRRLGLWGKLGEHVGQDAAERTGITAHTGWAQASVGLAFPAHHLAHATHHGRMAALRRLHEDLTLAGRVLHTGPTIVHPLDMPHQHG